MSLIDSRQKKFWSAKEASAYIQVCTHTLYDWVRQAEGKKSWYNKKPSRIIGPPPPFRRFGRNKLFFPVDKFKAWADAPQQGQK